MTLHIVYAIKINLLYEIQNSLEGMLFFFQRFNHSQPFILRATHYIIEYSPGSNSRKARQEQNSASAITVLVDIEKQSFL